MSRYLRLSLALLLPLVMAGASWAACGTACCPPKADCCQPACQQYVTRTVCVPEWVTEVRTVRAVEYTTEERQETCTVYKRVPETKTIQTECTVMVPETRTKTCKVTVCTPVWKEVEQQYTVMVPHQEKRQGVRKVCKMEQVKQTRTVCKDKGHWEEQVVEVAPASAKACASPCTARRACRLWARRSVCCAAPCATACTTACSAACDSGCDSCGGAGTAGAVQCVKKVWVPNIVQEQVEVTCSKPVMVEEPCEYTVTVCKPEARTRKVRVCEYQKEEKTRQVQYTVCVPQQRTVTREVCVVKCVPEQKVVTRTVQVPRCVEKQVEVRVCKMVQKTVQVPCGPARTRCCARPARGCCAPKAACACAPCAGC
jgi:hypothetical protein